MRCQRLQLGRFFARSILELLLISMPLFIVSSVQDRAEAASYQQTIDFALTIPAAVGV